MQGYCERLGSKRDREREVEEVRAGEDEVMRGQEGLGCDGRRRGDGTANIWWLYGKMRREKSKMERGGRVMDVRLQAVLSSQSLATQIYFFALYLSLFSTYLTFPAAFPSISFRSIVTWWAEREAEALPHHPITAGPLLSATWYKVKKCLYSKIDSFSPTFFQNHLSSTCHRMSLSCHMTMWVI